MLSVRDLDEQMASLLGADTASLAAPTTFVALHLAKAAFTPAKDLVVGDVTEADFDGYAAIHAASAATQVFTDPVTSELVLQVNEPAGGWHWVTGAGFTPPQTVYGFYLTNAAGTKLWASELFEEPIELTAVGQAVDVDQARLSLALSPLN